MLGNGDGFSGRDLVGDAGHRGRFHLIGELGAEDGRHKTGNNGHDGHHHPGLIVYPFFDHTGQGLLFGRRQAGKKPVLIPIVNRQNAFQVGIEIFFRRLDLASRRPGRGRLSGIIGQGRQIEGGQYQQKSNK